MMKFNPNHICDMTCSATFGLAQRLYVACLRVLWWCYNFCIASCSVAGCLSSSGQEEIKFFKFHKDQAWYVCFNSWCNGFIMCCLIQQRNQVQIMSAFNLFNITQKFSTYTMFVMFTDELFRSFETIYSTFRGLPEMSTRNILWGKGQLACRADNFTAIYEPIV
jgi:hypothetical protein